jgi:hypothetical protein
MSEASQTLQSYRELAERLTESTGRLDSVLERADDLLGSDQIEQVVTEANQAMRAIRETAENLNARVGPITAGLERFSGQGLREAEALIRDSRRSINRIEQAISAFERNPQRILTGGEGGFASMTGGSGVDIPGPPPSMKTSRSRVSNRIGAGSRSEIPVSSIGRRVRPACPAGLCRAPRAGPCRARHLRSEPPPWRRRARAFAHAIADRRAIGLALARCREHRRADRARLDRISERRAVGRPAARAIVQARLADAFQATGRLGGVGRPGEGLAIDYQVVSDIRAFEVRVFGQRRATVEMSVRILNDRNGVVRATRVFQAEVPLTGHGNDAYVAPSTGRISSWQPNWCRGCWRPSDEAFDSMISVEMRKAAPVRANAPPSEIVLDDLLVVKAEQGIFPLPAGEAAIERIVELDRRPLVARIHPHASSESLIHEYPRSDAAAF